MGSIYRWAMISDGQEYLICYIFINMLLTKNINLNVKYEEKNYTSSLPFYFLLPDV